MKIFVRMVMLSAVLAVISAGWLGCGGNNGTGPSGGTAPRITTSTLPSGTAGTAYSQAIMATGDTPITWSLVSGALPTGLSLFENGIVSGTPIAAGTSNFSVKASNSAGNDTKSFSITITGGPTIPITPTTQSIDGVWDFSGLKITVSGSTGIISQFSTTNALWTDAMNKGYVKIGDPYWKNLTSTGNLTWSGQMLKVTYNASTNAATGIGWGNCTFTLSPDGQTLTITDSGAGFTQTWTRSNYSLDGVWVNGGLKVTVSGSTGIISQFSTTSALWTDAMNKGYVKIGDPYWKNLTSTGNLTWSGQMLMVTYNTSTNAATGINWGNCTFTLSTNGQTLTIKDGTNTVGTYTQQQ
jgi:hypothetical protein